MFYALNLFWIVGNLSRSMYCLGNVNYFCMRSSCSGACLV